MTLKKIVLRRVQIFADQRPLFIFRSKRHLDFFCKKAGLKTFLKDPYQGYLKGINGRCLPWEFGEVFIVPPHDFFCKLKKNFVVINLGNHLALGSKLLLFNLIFCYLCDTECRQGFENCFSGTKNYVN